jgi:hypothetical protein
MATLNKAEKLSPEKLKAIAQVLVQNKLESNASNFGDIEWLANGWQIEYGVGGRRFYLKFLEEQKVFVKGVVGVEADESDIKDAAEFAESEEDVSLFNFDALFADSGTVEFGDWGDQIDQLLAECSSLQEFSERLPEIYGDLPTDQHAQVLASAMTAASMAGLLESR